MKNILKEIKKLKKGCYMKTIESVVDGRFYVTVEYIWLGKCSLRFRHHMGMYNIHNKDAHNNVKISFLRYNDLKNIVSVDYNREDKKAYDDLLCYCVKSSIPDEGIVYEQSRKAKRWDTKSINKLKNEISSTTLALS